MATVVDRYWEAVSYVHRAVDEVESAPSLLNIADRYAAKVKTQPVRDELSRVESRWLRATNDIDRAQIARDAELLADRTKENLPGAPQSWTRTNLYAAEVEKSTPATSYGEELAAEAEHDWTWLKDKAGAAAGAGKGIAQWLLVGGGLFVAYKLVDYLRAHEQRTATSTARALNSGLEHAAVESERSS
jgi:hypothetical protein